MPWQQQVADVGGEIDDDGKPVYREVIFSTPRQSGKTTLELAWVQQRAKGWADMLGAPQKMLYTAQTGLDARKKLLNDWYPVLWPRRSVLGIKTIPKANGSEAIVWRNGSRLDLMGSGEDAGHGRSLDMPMLDELFADKDLRRDQAVLPGMLTRPFAQQLTCSTMGTPESVAWNGKVALGRASTEPGTGTCYFEWSADANDDPADPDVWARCMPALGYTQSVEAVAHAYRTMLSAGKLGEFKRAFLNIPTAAEEQVIPGASWDLVNDPDIEATPGVLAFDCNPERSAAGIVMAGGGIVEVVEYQSGVGWLVPALVDLHTKYRVPVAVDASGPAGAFIPDLERAGIDVVAFPVRDLARASGRFYDDVVTQGVKIRRDPDLDASVACANKRMVGDAWAWGRKTSTGDISLLVAATVGHFQSQVAPFDVAANVW